MQRRIPLRRRMLATAIGAGLALSLTTAAGGAAAQPQAQARCPWLNTALPTPARVHLLVSHMTLEQQASLMKVLPGTGAYQGYQVMTPPIPELCLPALIQQDGPAAVLSTGVTEFPAPIALAATFDPEMAHSYGDALGSEFRGKGIMMAHAPNVNLVRVPQWGRDFETLGEDPYLTAHLAVPEIRAIQGNGVVADVKHIAEYNQDLHVHPASFVPGEVPVDVAISTRTMQETELAVFEAAIRKGHAGAAMCSFTVINGEPACQNPQIMGGLRNTMGFDGMIRSDRPSTVTNLPRAIDQGMDQSFEFTPEQILAAVHAGELTRRQIATAAEHILLPMFQVGVMDRPWQNTIAANVSTPANQQVALRTAEQSTVLLRNENNALPLDRGASIAVIGAPASTDPITRQAFFGWKPPLSPGLVTPLQAITARAPHVIYEEGAPSGDPVQDAKDIAAAVNAARSSQVAIVFAGIRAGEGRDLQSNTLAGDGIRTDQDQLIEAVAKANPNTIVVLDTANPVLMPWRDDVAGIVEGWYGGQLGGEAVAKVLFGEVNPSGKLPMTFPATAEQPLSADATRYPGVNGQESYSEGLDIGYKWYDANNLTPLYPFGYGLSYTTFAFSGIRVSARDRAVDPNRSPDAVVATVRATVTNTGTRAGREVGQLYLTDPASAGEPVRQLRGFQPVTLDPGQAATVTFTLTARDLAYFDDRAGSWRTAAGRYQVSVGSSSAPEDLPLTAAFTIR